MTGKIVKALSGFYYVSSEDSLYECKARGILRRDGISPVVGDTVEFTVTDSTHGVVDKVCNRKNLLSRPCVANIDCLVIVSSHSVPAPDALLIDRLCAIAVFNEIQPVIVFNKCDIGDFYDWERIYRNSGFKVFVVSAVTGEGIEELKAEIKGKVCAFSGNTGVGKSSLINALFTGLDIKTGEVSQKLGRGRHTTRHTEIYGNDQDGYIVDTPGFSSIETADNYSFKEHLAECFPEFCEVSQNCKFNSCTHTCETNCAVLEALSQGKIEKSRHDSYLVMYNELKDLKPWNSKKVN